SNDVHMGDTFFNKLYPFIDTSSGGTVAGELAAADGVLKTAGDGTKIIPGHGPLASKADLKAYRKMLAQVIASKPTAKYDEVWGKGFLAPEKFVEMIYGNLKK